MHWSTDGCKELWARIVRESSAPFKWTDMPDVTHGNRLICPLQEDPSQVGRKPCNVPPVFPDLDRPLFGYCTSFESKMKQFMQFRRFVRASFAENHKQIDAAANAVLIHFSLIIIHQCGRSLPPHS